MYNNYEINFKGMSWQTYCQEHCCCSAWKCMLYTKDIVSVHDWNDTDLVTPVIPQTVCIVAPVV